MGPFALDNFLEGDYDKVCAGLFSQATSDSISLNGLKLCWGQVSLHIKKKILHGKELSNIGTVCLVKWLFHYPWKILKDI